MEYEYVALEWDTEDLPKNNPRFVRERYDLIAQGWEEACRATWHGPKLGGACIMRRPKEELHKWTRAELEVMLGDWHEALHDTMRIDKEETRGSVLNERAMQADLCGRLERRNAELLEAIDKVVNAARNPNLQEKSYLNSAIYLSSAVKEFLYPLVTKTAVAHGSNWTIKEESNG